MIAWVEPTEETQQRLSVSSSHVWKLFVISHHCCKESLGVLKIWPAEDFFNVIFVTVDIYLFVDIFATNIADANFKTGPSFYCLFYVRNIRFPIFVQRSRREPWTSISKCLFMCVCACHQILGLWLVELLASDSGSGILLIRLGVLSLAEQCHTQIF